MRRRLPVIGGVIGALLAAVVVAAILVVLVFGETYRIHGESMEPTLKAGDRVAVIRFRGPVQPEIGDVVAYRAPEEAAAECGAAGTYLHRVVRITSEGYMMRGDNEQFSCDSRVFGPVPGSALIGEVVAVYWPPGRIGLR